MDSWIQKQMQINKVCWLNWPLPVNSSQVKKQKKNQNNNCWCIYIVTTLNFKNEIKINEGTHPEGYYDAVTADHHTSVAAWTQSQTIASCVVLCWTRLRRKSHIQTTLLGALLTSQTAATEWYTATMKCAKSFYCCRQFQLALLTIS